MMKKLAILALLGVFATLLSAAPASATNSTEVKVERLSNGRLSTTLRITGDDGDNNIDVRRTAPDEWEVTIFDFDFNVIKQVKVRNVDNVVVNTKGGDDFVRIEDDLEGRIPTLRNLDVITGKGTNFLRVRGVAATGNMFVTVDSGALEIVNSSAKGVIARSNNGRVEMDWDSVRSRNVTHIDTGNGPSEIVIRDSTFARTQIKGGNQEDVVLVLNTDMGKLPSVNTLAEEDLVLLLDVEYTRRLAIRTGAGDDLTGIRRVLPPEEIPTELVSLNLNNGAGDDLTTILGHVGPGDLLNGGSGSGDDLSLCSGDSGATIRLFETVGTTGCD